MSIGEDSFEVQQQMHGEFFSTASLHSLEWVAAAGAMLGRIHQASRRYTGPQHRWPAEMHIGSMVQSYLNLARAQADASSIHAISAALSDWVDQWEAVLPAAMVAIGAGKNLPEFHIHGDYHALNLRFGTEGVSAVTGFEASRWEKRIFEVAYGLFYFSTLSWLPGSDETTPLVKRGFEPERARAFLQGYAEIYPPAPGEAALLTDALLLISPLATINGPLEDLFYAQAEDVDTTAIDNLMERLVWATAFPGWVSRIRSSLPDMWG